MVIDAYSTCLKVHCMKSTTSGATIEKLRKIFAKHGLPATLVSDNGSNFTSSEFQEFMKTNGIKHIKVAPHHPTSNGLAERTVRVANEGFEKIAGGTFKRSYLDPFSVIEQPLRVRLECNPQSYR